VAVDGPWAEAAARQAAAAFLAPDSPSPMTAWKLRTLMTLGVDHVAAMRITLLALAKLDAGVGRIMAQLEAMRIERSTLLAFTSDHGPDMHGAADLPSSPNWCPFCLGSSGKFNGGKTTMWEGGLRVPLIVRWPQAVPAGRVDSRTVASAYDWLPTVLDLAGASAAADG
jgi:N-acetylgalactosamine-6-sulfatase